MNTPDEQPTRRRCFFPPQLSDLDSLDKTLLGRIVQLEALHARPLAASPITEYLRERSLLTAEEIDQLIALAPGLLDHPPTAERMPRNTWVSSRRVIHPAGEPA